MSTDNTDPVPEPPIGDWTAQLDQTMANLKDLTRMFRAYHQGCLEAGFSEPQAFAMLLGYQQAICGGKMQ